MEPLRTERLIIREFRLSDDEFVLRLLNEKTFLRYIGDKGVRSLDDARQYLSTGPISSYQAHGFGLCHVAQKSTGTAIGMCGLLRRDDQQYPDIGFAFLPEYQANGYAFESALAVLAHGHQQLSLNKIVAFVNPDNGRSIRLLTRLGITFDGNTVLAGIDNEQSMYSARVEDDNIA